MVSCSRILAVAGLKKELGFLDVFFLGFLGGFLLLQGFTRAAWLPQSFHAIAGRFLLGFQDVFF
jgi:hypothetical protein